MSSKPSKRNPVARFMNIFNKPSRHTSQRVTPARESINEGLSEVTRKVSSGTSNSSSHVSHATSSYYDSSSSGDSCSSSSSGGGCD